ncbi:MAG: uroporphyrinogen-III synthase [Candidatus Limnocylindrales bacterium]
MTRGSARPDRWATGRVGPGPAILVTRPTGEQDPLVALLARGGLRAHGVPTVVTEEVAPGGALDAAAGELASYDWVVLTSVQAVAALAAAARRAAAGRSGTAPGAGAGTAGGADSARGAIGTGGPRPAYAAVGPATARALVAQGAIVALQAPDATGAGLARALRAAGELAGRRVLLPRASAATPELPRALRASGAEVHEVIAYRTVEAPATSRGLLAAALADPDLAAVVVASGSAVRGLLRLAAAPDLPAESVETVRGLPFVSIGPATSREVQRLGLWLAAEAATPTVEALAAATLALVEGGGDLARGESPGSHGTEVHA